MAAMTGKTVLVTGGTGGIGKEIGRGLARLGARVLLVGRDGGRAAETVRELRQHTGNDSVEAITADITRKADLHRLADEVAQRCDTLYALVNNATASRPRRELTEDGIEVVFAANVLAPFVLTRSLMPLLAAGTQARVVNIAGGIPKGRIDLHNLQGERAYNGRLLDTHYNHAKRVLMAMSYEYAQRLRSRGVTVNVAYPGHAFTPGNKALTIGSFPLAVRPLVPVLKLVLPVFYGGGAVAKAAQPSIHLVSSPDVAGVNGTYFASGGRPTAWPRFATDPRNRTAIWDLCAKLADQPRASRTSR